MIREYAKPDHERVTAGLPSLTSTKRLTITEKQLKRIYHDALVKEYVDNAKAAVAPDGKRDTTNPEAQAGVPLTGPQIVKRLLKLNPSLWFEVSKADETKLGIYYMDWTAKERRFLCGMEANVSPEFSVRVTDDKGDFKREIRGWRTVLHRLIKSQFISESGAFTQFGPPNRDSENWARLWA